MIQKLNGSVSIPPDCFKIVNIGDLHFGNRYLGTTHFLDKIEKYIVPVLKSGIHILFIPGDFFDRLFTMDHRISRLSIRLIKRFILLALEHNFVIRVVRGTYTHDHDQNKHWIETAKEYEDSNPDVVKVFDVITYESLQGLDIVYIPDNAPKNAMSIVRRLMKDREIIKLDFIVGHGYFQHVLPPGKPIHETVFDANIMSEVAVCTIFGHIHIFSIHKNVIYTGPFDRFRHGEEDDKGFVVVYYSKENNYLRYEFIKNPDSIVFRTYDFTSIVDQKVLVDKYTQIVENINLQNNDIGHIRILIHEPLFKNILVDYSRKFPHINLTFKKLKTTTSTQNKTTSISTLKIITKENLNKMIFDELKGQLTLIEIDEILDSL